MRKLLILLCIGTLCLFKAYGASIPVTALDAVETVKHNFEGRDVDYYVQSDLATTTPDYWTVLVDAEPMRGWPHECYTYKVHKYTPNTLGGVARFQYVPEGNFSPVDVKNRYGGNSTSKPIVARVTASNDAAFAAQRTYALIINGGVRPMSNYERYWNDCSFIYQTLTNKYGIPKDHIIPLMSDGDNPGLDMNTGADGFKSQSLDLDFDGKNEISLAATRDNVYSVLNSLKTKMQPDDHLFIYVMDHGGSNTGHTTSFICLWNEEKLYDYELASLLSPFTSKMVNVNVVLGQCYAGGFINKLKMKGCVVAAACQGDESSWACSDRPYDEFVYQWTSAVNGANHRGGPVNADSDGNGYITMEEAFAYAKAHDRQTSREHPQYSSTPLSVGEDLAFDRLVPGIDLYIKDNPEDTGKQPNLTTDKFWTSPSIWVRNKADGVEEHQNPYYSEDHVAATIYVRVYNRGKQDYLGNTKYVHVYWAKASTGFHPDAWMGNEVYTNGQVTGGYLTPCVIPKIPAGSYVDVAITWGLPADLLGNPSDNGTEKHHFCLLAKVLDTHRSPILDGSFSYNCRASNKDAQKNVSIITRSDLTKGTNVFIRNVYDKIQKYTLELVPRTSADEAIFNVAKIEMTMSDPIYYGWNRGGQMGNEINRPTPDAPRTVYFTSKESRLEDISLRQYQFDKVTMKVHFNYIPVAEKEYTLDLIQRDESGAIIGGETFVIHLSQLLINPPTPPIITPILKENGEVELTTDADDTQSLRWEDSEGNVIGETETVTVVPTPKADNTYHVFALTEEGTMENASIELEPSVGLQSVAMDHMGLALTVSLLNEPLAGSCVTVSSMTTGETMASLDMESLAKTVSIDSSLWTTGIYVVSYMVDGTVLDAIKVIKK